MHIMVSRQSISGPSPQDTGISVDSLTHVEQKVGFISKRGVVHSRKGFLEDVFVHDVFDLQLYD